MYWIGIALIAIAALLGLLSACANKPNQKAILLYVLLYLVGWMLAVAGQNP